MSLRSPLYRPKMTQNALVIPKAITGSSPQAIIFQ